MNHAGEDAWRLLELGTRGPGLRRHVRSVEIAMRAYTLHLGEDPNRWLAAVDEGLVVETMKDRSMTRDVHRESGRAGAALVRDAPPPAGDELGLNP
ncbi:MAG: hypothetical protein ACREOS_13260 [Candidatus Dormibacteraceae bacterium]